MYSLDGSTYLQYSAPLNLNPAQTPTIYVFADDNVANRSGVFTKDLTPNAAGYTVTGPTVATLGSQITANWTAPAGRPAYDWIGLYQQGTLNSAFLAKQFTGGTASGSVALTLPSQPGVYELRYLLNNGYTSTAVSSSINVSVPAVRAPFDFDGDERTDISVFRPSNGQWWLGRSTAGLIVHTFGNSADLPVPGDFTGDRSTDVAIFRPSNGEWFVLRSENFTFYSFPFGASGDLPVPGDYDGDGRTDAAVFRPSNATWYIQRSSGGTTIQGFGASTDRPVPADYDGDGKTDIAIYRPSLGQWWLNRSTAGVIVHTFGNSADRNVPGDYTGDGKADVAIFRPSNGEWFILRSEDFSFYSFPFGISTDLPVPGDYDGDGKFDAGIFRPSNSTWYINRSTAGILIQGFGASTDLPVPNSFVR
jgi:putative transposon-encoded protein